MLFLLALLVPGQTSYPMVTHVHPVAVRSGATATVVVSGQMNFAGATGVLFEGDDVSAKVVPEKVPPAKDAPVRSVTLSVTVAAGTMPGVRDFRVVTKTGLSSVGQLVISADPVVVEGAINDTAEKAESIPVPSTVAGRIEALEDVDHFRFAAKKGRTVTMEVRCARIQDRIHDLQKHADPIVTVYDSEGRELAADDDTYFADPVLRFTPPADGAYVVQVRDSKYDGDPRWVYALHVTDRPYATQAFPSAVRAGEKVTVEAVGVGPVAVVAPKAVGITEVMLPGVANPVPLIVSDLPQVTEAEPNDEFRAGQRVALPAGINGRIGKARDADCFRFAGKKGVALRFEVKARRFGTLLRSRLDSVLEVLSPGGVVVATNDDANGKDALLVFTPTADADYTLRVRDLNGKGGDEFVYHIDARLATPDFSLRCDGDKAMIHPGGHVSWYVHVVRSNGFAGPVTVRARNLPQGVTASELTIPANMTQGLMVLSATADAKPVAVNASLEGSAELVIDGKPRAETRPVVANQEIYLPGGGRGVFGVAQMSVAVVEPGDILSVEVTPAEVVLKPGDEVRLDVRVVRRAGFTQAVQLDAILRHLGSQYGNPLPPGVTMVEAKSKTLLGAGDRGHIVLKAAADAPESVGVPVSVLANVSVNFVVKMSYSSKALRVTVRKGETR